MGQGKEGKRIILAENFRSRKDVLDFTNLVFSQLMDEQVGRFPTMSQLLWFMVLINFRRRLIIQLNC